MENFHCSYLSGYVKLSEERERHIRKSHPDLLPEYKCVLWDVLHLISFRILGCEIQQIFHQGDPKMEISTLSIFTFL